MDIQLKCCDSSKFFDKAFLDSKDIEMSVFLKRLREFVIKFLIHVSRDFATSSFQGEVTWESLKDIVIDGREVEQYQIAGRRHWEKK